jgi:lipopolysaccharide biosynthesis glycosyltransferase
MFVSACNRPYILLTKAWARSLIKNGKISQSEITIIAFGNDSVDSLLIEQDIRRELKQVNIIKVCSKWKEFAFLQNDDRRRKNLWFSDYLRAWVGKELSSYIWMDSDILVMKDMAPLLETMNSASTLHLAREASKTKRYPRNFTGKEYFALYSKCFEEAPFHDSSHVPIRMNCGVIVSDRDYSKEWKNLYNKIMAVGDLSKIGRMEDLGQAIWNIIFWKNGGQKLNSRYNSFSDHSHQNAAVVHYARGHKSAMARAAFKLGFA